MDLSKGGLYVVLYRILIDIVKKIILNDVNASTYFVPGLQQNFKLTWPTANNIATTYGNFPSDDFKGKTTIHNPVQYSFRFFV